MKPWAASRYRCPLCGAPLTLTVFEQHDVRIAPDRTEQLRSLNLPLHEFETEIDSGMFHCQDEDVFFPVFRGIPVLLPYVTPLHQTFERECAQWAEYWRGMLRPTGDPFPGEGVTSATFTREWETVGNDDLTFTYTHAQREAFIAMELDWELRDTPAPDFSTLNVGCGFGMESLFMANVTKRPVFGTDINLSLLSVQKHIETHPLVHVAIASAFAPPFAQESFDQVYSHGVLHHTYNTARAFQSILRFRKPQGCIAIWLYAHEDSQRGKRGRKVEYIVEQLVRPYIARLPHALQRWVIKALALKHYVRYRKKGLQRELWSFRNSEHSMYDRWACRYAHRHSFNEVICWFLEAGLEYRLLNPVTYRNTLHRHLMGIGILGCPPLQDPTAGHQAPSEGA